MPSGQNNYLAQLKSSRQSPQNTLQSFPCLAITRQPVTVAPNIQAYTCAAEEALLIGRLGQPVVSLQKPFASSELCSPLLCVDNKTILFKLTFSLAGDELNKPPCHNEIVCIRRAHYRDYMHQIQAYTLSEHDFRGSHSI